MNEEGLYLHPLGTNSTRASESVNEYIVRDVFDACSGVTDKGGSQGTATCNAQAPCPEYSEEPPGTSCEADSCEYCAASQDVVGRMAPYLEVLKILSTLNQNAFESYPHTNQTKPRESHLPLTMTSVPRVVSQCSNSTTSSLEPPSDKPPTCRETSNHIVNRNNAGLYSDQCGNAHRPNSFKEAKSICVHYESNEQCTGNIAVMSRGGESPETSDRTSVGFTSSAQLDQPLGSRITAHMGRPDGKVSSTQLKRSLRSVPWGLILMTLTVSLGNPVFLPVVLYYTGQGVQTWRVGRQGAAVWNLNRAATVAFFGLLITLSMLSTVYILRLRVVRDLFCPQGDTDIDVNGAATGDIFSTVSPTTSVKATKHMSSKAPRKNSNACDGTQYESIATRSVVSERKITSLMRSSGMTKWEQSPCNATCIQVRNKETNEVTVYCT